MGEVVLDCAGSCIVCAAKVVFCLWLFLLSICIILGITDAFLEAHQIVVRKVLREFAPDFLRNHKKLLAVIFFVVVTTGVVLVKF